MSRKQVPQLAPDMHTSLLGPISRQDLGAFSERALAYSKLIKCKNLSEAYKNFHISAETLKGLIDD